MGNGFWFFAASVFFIGLCGCATTPHEIEENKYLDKESGYSFEMPTKWKVANQIPLFLEDGIKAILDPEGCQILTNPSETAAILAVSFEHSFRWTQIQQHLQITSTKTDTQAIDWHSQPLYL